MRSRLPQILAMYLPQFHEIVENNKWWGEGFTEWTNVKKAKPLFRGHIQPREPYKNIYYDLSDPDVLKNQMQLALGYGVDGFCIYHYWFKGKKLLEKPLEQLLVEERVILPFCICWANESWTRTWDGDAGAKQILIEQDYGNEEDWVTHFKYLNQFFQKEEYIKVDGKPLIVIYKLSLVNHRREMLKVWNQMAKDMGFPGIFVLSMQRTDISKDIPIQGDGVADFEPFATFARMNTVEREKITCTHRGNKKENFLMRYQVVDYTKFCEIMVSRFIGRNTNHYLGFFVGWDNTPRRGFQTKLIFENNTPEQFEKYFSIQYERSIGASNEFIFINAWNEWGEGTFLEPDNKYLYGYLSAIKRIKQKFE